MSTTELTGKVALVTGGATGIGAGIVLELARRGADVAFTHLRHSPDEVIESVRRLGRRTLADSVDATDAASVGAFVKRVAEEFGAIDILVNNAGGLVARQSLEDTTDEHWRHVIDLNLSSTFYVVRESVAFMPNGARVISVSSLAGRNGGGAGALAYAAAKAGVHGLTRALAKELAPRQITVNAVAPGFILDTPFHDEFTAPEAQVAAIGGIPLRRAGAPVDVAGAVAFLASPDASFCTGVVLDVNGGSHFA